MSMTLYLKNGAPAGARPRAPSQPNTSPSRAPSPASSAIVTRVLIATYGCSARVAISGAAGICSSSGRIDWLLQFSNPLIRVSGPFEGDLAGIADGAVPVSIDPPRQSLAGGQDVVN